MTQRKERFQRAVAKKNTSQQPRRNWLILAIVALVSTALLLHDRGGISTDRGDLILAGISLALFGFAAWKWYSFPAKKLNSPDKF